jgi:signal recognition particle subunit SRP54
MVLGELGSQLTKALHQISTASTIDAAVLDSFLKEICTALLQADVNVKQVMGLRNGVKNRVNLEQLAAGLNKQRIIEKAVFDELCAILDSSPAEPSKLEVKKGKPTVVMFVGLQVKK